MLLVEDVDRKEFLTGLFRAMYEELPAPKKRENDNYFSQYIWKTISKMKKRRMDPWCGEAHTPFTFCLY